MGKIYRNQNVLDATIERIYYIFANFDLIYISVSGGKDSSVMVQLVNMIAKKLNRKYDVLFVDFEAQYKATMHHINELKQLKQLRNFYHIVLPFNLSNANSIFQPHWQSWNPDEIQKWVRDMPEGKNIINITNHEFGENFIRGDEFEQFIVKFPEWLRNKYNKEKIACLVGIRTDESFNRFRSIAFGKSIYKKKMWSTEIKPNIFNLYPIYDWKTQDIWGCVSKLNLLFNNVYEMLYKNGISIHEQRICQPYGSDQRVSLNQWSVLEPETWAKIVNRVSGVNFGNIYCKTSLLGHNGTEKPNHMKWEEYLVFLLESLGFYSITLRNHYIRKIKILFEYYKVNENLEIKDIPDELTPKEIKLEYSESGKWLHWKRIARCVEKNDFSCKSLSYGLTNTDKEVIIKLKKVWKNDLGIQTNTKEMRNLILLLNETN